MDSLKAWEKEVKSLFRGSFEAELDENGVFCLPSKFKQALADRAKISAAVAFLYVDELCIYAYDDYEFLSNYALEYMRQRKGIENLPFEMSQWHEAYVAQWVQDGEVQIPKDLLVRARLQPRNKLVIIGVGDHIEVWEQGDWEAYNGILDDARSMDAFYRAMDVARK